MKEQADADLTSHRLGTVRLEPSGPVTAGCVGEWTFRYTVGSYGIDEHGTIKLVQRFASDWEEPQFDNPEGLGFTTVATDGQARLAVSYQRKAHQRPWTKGLVIDIYDGFLAPRDTVTVVLGDQGQGSPGIRAQTFQETAHEFRFLVDPTNAHVVERLPSSPTIPVVAGMPSRLVCILPTDATVGKRVRISVKGEDRWGNPTEPPNSLLLSWEGEGDVAIEEKHLIFRSSGSGHVVASGKDDEAILCCRSNPITAHDSKPRYGRFWGDLHAQTEATVGTGTEREYFTFGRDIACLDFTSHQGNDFQMSDEDWQRLNETVREFHEDGRFVVFPGYEWSANTPAGGDRNVFFREEGWPIIRSKNWQIPETTEDEVTPAHPADVLFRRIRDRIDLDQVLLGSHVGGRYADVRQYFDSQLGPLVEIVSCWGVFEWMLWDALAKGYFVGVMCNSDGHKGRPGAEGPGAGEFGIGNGLTCALAESLTRESVFAALKARRCYGTTGPRIDLSFDICGHPMGSIIQTRQSKLQVRAGVRGTAPLESLSLLQGKEVQETARPKAFAALGKSNRVRVSWSGSRIRGRGRRAVWDGAIRLTGAKVVKATPFAFDSAADGIRKQTDREVVFSSSTTGDRDGIDLFLDQASGGTLEFQSAVGSCGADLAKLGEEKQRFDMGGLDMEVVVERYPEQLTVFSTELETEIQFSGAGATPYLVKAVQEDGHMAWSSPIYVSP